NMTVSFPRCLRVGEAMYLERTTLLCACTGYAGRIGVKCSLDGCMFPYSRVLKEVPHSWTRLAERGTEQLREGLMKSEQIVAGGPSQLLTLRPFTYQSIWFLDGCRSVARQRRTRNSIYGATACITII